MADVRQAIRDRLANGPVWTRSFQQVKPVLDRMIADGEVLRCKPHLGRGNNMVCLAPSAQRPMTMLDHFAELLSQHGDVQKAAAELGKSRGWGQAALREIRRQLGPQAQ